ncbi:hypothetical protein ABEB36_008754 [Hypothenemus hampei]|uniref:Uncharacterized protein n=1 Tax=Hypothenemus hampei TaxID=57062 RepID=A0ABD1EMY7_HYPHA
MISSNSSLEKFFVKKDILLQNIRSVKWMNNRALPKEQYQPAYIEHIANIITHAIWIFPSILATIELYTRSENDAQILSALVYGLTLISLFSISTLFHCCFYCKNQRFVKDVLHRCDRGMIYIFIAGSYFPWLTIEKLPQGGVSSHMQWIIWIMALMGIIYQQIFHEKYKRLEILFYLIMGICPVLPILSEIYQYKTRSSENTPSLWSKYLRNYRHRNMDTIGGSNLIGKRALDSIGGGRLLNTRAIDNIGGGGILFSRREFDNLLKSMDDIGGGNILLSAPYENTNDMTGEGILATREVDSIGGGGILRSVDDIGGGSILAARAIDNIGGGSILAYRRLDNIGGGLLASRSVDGIGGDTLIGRSLDNIGTGGGLLISRSVDGIGGDTLIGRSLDNIGTGGGLLISRSVDGIGGDTLIGRSIDDIGGGSLLYTKE